MPVAELKPFETAAGIGAESEGRSRGTCGHLFSLENKVAVVTGALGLLGKNHAAALAGAGATVVIVDLDGAACREFAAEVAVEHRRPALGVAADVTSQESVRALADQVAAAFDRVDVLVNNAAINDIFGECEDEPVGLERYPLEMWKRVLDVNLTGAFLCSQVIGAGMARRGSGSIINVASTYGVVAPDQSIYCKPDGVQAFYKSPVYPAAKAGILALTRYMAAYWGPAGVRVNSLSPGGVENSQADFFIRNYSARTPLKRMARQDEYRGAVVFLASQASSYMTGANLIVDGGWTAW